MPVLHAMAMCDRLTFGVELEFFIQCGPSDSHSSRSSGHNLRSRSASGPSIKQRIANVLRNAGFEVNNPDYPKKAICNKWTVADDDSLVFRRSRNMQKHLKHRCRGKCFKADGNKWKGLELKTPVLRIMDCLWKKMIEYAITILHDTFPDIRVNRTCGMHVHVGDGVSSCFPISTLKNLAALTVAFESQLNTLHPSHRQNNLHARSVAAANYNFGGFDAEDILDEIESVDSKDKLAALLCPGRGRYLKRSRRWAYNFTPVASTGSSLDAANDDLYGNGDSDSGDDEEPQEGQVKGTVEFRQHEGTMDWQEVVKWVEVVTALVGFASAVVSAI